MRKNGTGPVIRMSSASTHAAGGVECCFCRCCTCIHLEFLKTMPGVLKLAETIISGLIQSLLVNYGLRYSSTIGSAFEGSLTTSSACFLTSAVLLACYVVSEKSYRSIRSSLFVRASCVHGSLSLGRLGEPPITAILRPVSGNHVQRSGFLSILELGRLLGLLHKDIPPSGILYQAGIRRLSRDDGCLHHERLRRSATRSGRVLLLRPLQDRKMNRSRSEIYEEIARRFAIESTRVSNTIRFELYSNRPEIFKPRQWEQHPCREQLGARRYL